jgi:hypothetical protein
MNRRVVRNVFWSAGTVVVVLLAVSASPAGLITFTADYSHINQTDNTGTLTTPAERSPLHLCDGTTLTTSGGTVIASTTGGSLTTSGTTYWSSGSGDAGNLWNGGSGGSVPPGSMGLLIDLGNYYQIDAIQMYGYNFSSYWAGRSIKNFTLETARDPSTVTTSGGNLIIVSTGGFTTVGGIQTTTNLSSSNMYTDGDTFLFGGAVQPSDVTGATHSVTPNQTEARYLFFTGLTIWGTSGQGHDTAGLSGLRIYGEQVPEPSTLALLGVGTIGLLG